MVILKPHSDCMGVYVGVHEKGKVKYIMVFGLVLAGCQIIKYMHVSHITCMRSHSHSLLSQTLTNDKSEGNS